MIKVKLISITVLVIINILLVFLIISFPSLKEILARFFMLNDKKWKNYRLADIIRFNAKNPNDELIINGKKSMYKQETIIKLRELPIKMLNRNFYYF